jgi:hypothetical protein
MRGSPTDRDGEKTCEYERATGRKGGWGGEDEGEGVGETDGQRERSD